MARLSTFAVTPSFIVSGATASATLTLANPSSDAGGSVVALASGSGAVRLPASVTVHQNATSVAFDVTAASVTQPERVTLVVTYGGAMQRVEVIVAPQNAVTIGSFAVSPARVVGGVAATGTVTLTGPAPFGGAPVQIAARRRNIATVPQTITIPEGATVATFSIATDVLHAQREKAVEIAASYNGVTATAVLVVTPTLVAATRQPVALCASATLVPCITRTALDTATTAAAAYEYQYTLFTPELMLLAETAASTTSAPPVGWEYVWFGGQPLAQINASTGEIAWYFNDHLGTPIRQVAENGAILWAADYDAYGSPYVTTRGESRHQPLRLPGQTAEESVDIAYNVFRWYRSAVGRYTQSDPFRQPRASEPNLYAYARTNPLRFTDQLGLFAIDASCDCPARNGNIPKGIVNACSYAKKPACRTLLQRLTFNGQRLDRCLETRCADDTDPVHSEFQRVC